MEWFKKIKYVISAAYKAGIVYDQFTRKDFESNRLLGEIIRNTHSIEKGLSLDKVRLGFGYAKIKETISHIERFEALNGHLDVEQIRMFVDALSEYIEFHRSKLYNSPQFDEMSAIQRSFIHKIGLHEGKYGGVLRMEKPIYSDNERGLIERIIKDRHSIRAFEKTIVSDVDIKAAIELAMHCPSACNRQSYRVHIIDHRDFHILEGWLDGVGGFANDLDKMLLITGKISDYRPSEQLQYIVTPAVFAGYLTITLQVYGIGCCFIQRSLLPNRKFAKLSSKLNVPFDEQPVCILGIGNLKREYKVPVSHRLSYNKIVKTFKTGE